MIVVQKIVLSVYNVSKVKLFYKILNLNLNLKPVKTMTIPSKMTKKQNRSKRILSRMNIKRKESRRKRMSLRF